MKEGIMKNKDIILKFIDFLIVFFIALLSIKKGGFYKSDYLGFNFLISCIGIIYIILKAKFVFKEKKVKKDEILFLMFGLCISYSLPIIFQNYSNLSDALFEFTKYYNMLIIYFIVKNSASKNIYINGLIAISLLQCLLGIDQIAYRYLEDTLNQFNTGYLSTDLDRMSGTIQYANTFAILIVVSIILLVQKIDDNVLNKNFKLASIFNVLLTFLLICLILTKTRFALVILVLLLIVLMLSKNIISKKKVLIILLIDIILTMVSSSIIAGYMSLDNKKNIYFYIIIFMILFTILSYLFIKIIDRISFKFCKKTKAIFFITTFSLVVIYFILAFNIHATIKLNEKNNIYNADVYLKVEEKNNITIKLLKNDNSISGSKYRVKVSYIDNIEGQKVLFEEENLIEEKDVIYIDNINIDVKEFKCFKFEFECINGEVSIPNVEINQKKYAISYLLLPYKVIERILDGLTGSDSISSRFIYYKDAVKIITNSPKNFFIGCGGEAFKNMYNQFKDVTYISSEVHNSYLQIFCESGIFGFIFIVLIIIYVVKNYKLDTIKIALYALIIHSVLDLNFSYMIALTFFSILMGCLQEKKDCYCKNKKYVMHFIFLCILTVILAIIIFIEFKANIAKEIYVSDNESEYENVHDKETYINAMELYKKKFEYDMTEYKSLKLYINLKLEYVKFLNKTSDSYKLIYIKEQILEVDKLLKYMQKTNKYSKEALFYIFEVYYTYKSYFIYTYFDLDNEAGNVYYNDKMLDILNTIEKYFPKQASTIQKVDNKRSLLIY